MSRRLTSLFSYAVLTAAGVFFVFPVAWIFLLSIMPPADTFKIPPDVTFTPTLESYRTLFGGYHGAEITLYLKNSMLVSVGATGLVVGTGLLGAYATSQLRFRGRAFALASILVSRMLPPIAMIVPLFLYVSRLHALDQVSTLVVVYAAIILPFTFWLLHNFLNTIPTEVLDAARVDGCGELGIVRHVILPLAAPGLVSASLFAFTLAWTEYALASVLTSSGAKTLPLLINSFQSSEGVDWGPMAAGTIVAIAPPILVLVFGQKWLVAGLTGGAGR